MSNPPSRYLCLMFDELQEKVAEYRNLLDVERSLRARTRVQKQMLTFLKRQIKKAGGTVPSE